jgi:hypothetical protein
MRPRPLELVITALVPAIYWVAVRFSLPMPVKAVIGIGLLAAPGYLWSHVLLERRVRILERVAVACGLSLIVPVLGGLALYAVGVALNRTAWASLLTGVTLAGAVILIVQRRSKALQRIPRSTKRRPSWSAAAYGAAVVIAVGALAVARVGAAEQKYSGFTQLWLSARGGSGDSASLGISNHLGGTVRFRLVLLRRSRPSETWNVALANGQTWRRTIHLYGPQPITADLYKLPDLRRPYRFVTTDVELAKS